MRVFYWIALVVFLLVAVPSAGFFARYVATGDDRYRNLALRFYRWAALVALTTFNVAIFADIVETIVTW